MKITKDEIKDLASTINILITDQELNEIEASIKEITERFDEMLGVAENGIPMVTPSDNVNVFNENFEASDPTIMNNLNGFDSEYIKTRKVVNNE